MVLPYAISDSERTEHGATTIPMVLKEPDEIVAPMFFAWCTSVASASTSLMLKSVSAVSVSLAESLMTRCVSTPELFSTCRMRMP
ncbi:hypothetical protein D9M68_738460 [compost metagenome]